MRPARALIGFILVFALMFISINLRVGARVAHPQTQDLYVVKYTIPTSGNFTLTQTATAQILGIAQNGTGTPQIWLTYDRTEAKITRSFVGLKLGAEVPQGAIFRGFVNDPATGFSAVYETF